MSERFYITEPIINNQAILTGDEAHHLAKVMRAKAGDMVVLFDGVGTEHVAKIVSLEKNQVFLYVLQSQKSQNESWCEVTIAVSLPKGDRQKWMLEKLTELGCRRLIPLKTSRSVAQCDEKVLQRLKRQVLEASKQSERSFLMEIHPEMSLTELMVWKTEKMTALIAHPSSADDAGQCSIHEMLSKPLQKNVIVIIGPEGGLSMAEVTLAIHSGFIPVDLGPRLLRVETAAIAVTVCLTSLPLQ